MIRIATIIAVILASFALAVPSATGGQATVATATNFIAAAERIRTVFEAESDHVITFVAGSTGKLASQAALGAPFDVLLAADQDRPRWLVDNGHAVADSQFTYVSGRLVLWSNDSHRLSATGEGALETLRSGRFRRLSIANPDLAPYGAAAKQALQAMDIWQQAEPKLIYGENVLQAYAYAATGNADLALVAHSVVLAARTSNSGSFALIPTALHQPIRQDAILLRHGADNAAAKQFLSFLKRQDAVTIMNGLGYGALPGHSQ